MRRSEVRIVLLPSGACPYCVGPCLADHVHVDVMTEEPTDDPHVCLLGHELLAEPHERCLAAVDAWMADCTGVADA